MMKQHKLGVVMACILVAFCTLHVAASAPFAVDQQIVEHNMDAGGRVSGSIVATNPGDQPVKINIVPVDYVRNAKGDTVKATQEQLERSLFPYIALSASSLTLEPKSSAKLDYIIDMPETAEGSYWLAVYFEPETGTVVQGGALEGRPEVTFNFNLKIRYEVMFLVTINGTDNPNGAVTGMRQISQSDGLAFEVDFRNTGNVYYGAGGRVEIRDQTGATVAELPLERTFALPNQSYTFEVSDGSLQLPPGDYIALAVVDFGGDKLVAGQLRFAIHGREEAR